MKKTEYLQLELPFDTPQNIEKEEQKKSTATPLQNKEVKIDTRQRAKRRRIRVTFGDGTVCCDVSATMKKGYSESEWGGRISDKGFITKSRSCMRGCGIVSSSV